MRIQLHPEASAEIALEHDFYDKQRTGLGADLEEAINVALGMIAAMPNAWERWPSLAEVRVFHLERFPFSLPYWLDGERLVLLALAHAKRRPGYWHDRIRDV